MARTADTQLQSVRSRTRRLIIAGLLAIGIGLATAIFLLRDRWYDGLWLVIDVGDIGSITTADMSVRVYELKPRANEMVLVDTLPVRASDRSLRKWLPARDLLIVFEAKYVDRFPREIRFHRVIARSYFGDKWLTVRLPSAAEVQAHPRMAYIGSAAWLGGERAERREPLAPYWIDIAPPTIGEYLQFLLAAIDRGELEPIDSMIASDWLRRSGASEDLLGTAAGVRAIFSKPPPAGSLAAERECPAPMTYAEAMLFTANIGKRLPSPEQWELAVRGVDGRRFPWGDEIDPTRVNAGLPREVGWENRSRLRPFASFPTESPFGLLDTVGNAGDWTESPSGPVIMGGCFNQNVEDCTTFAAMGIPSSQSEILAATQLWLVTCRGVDAEWRAGK